MLKRNVAAETLGRTCVLLTIDRGKSFYDASMHGLPGVTLSEVALTLGAR